MYRDSFDVANPKGTGPIKPPKAISTLALFEKDECMSDNPIKKKPINIKVIPVSSNNLVSIFVVSVLY